MAVAALDRDRIPVPPDRIVDVNIQRLPTENRNAQDAWRALREHGDLIWTPQLGGHWIATSGAIVERIYRDPATFSNRVSNIPPGIFPIPLLPLQLDGLAHKASRALIEPAFRPAAVQRYGVNARALARELIEDLYPKGGCEFSWDFALVMPLVVFLSIVDLPLEDRIPLHGMSRRASRAPTVEERAAGFQEMVAYVDGWIERRSKAPGDDLISRIVHAEVDGKRLTRNEMLGTIILLLFAGLDTVASMMGYVMKYLAGAPQHRQWIRDNPLKISLATEELMRRHGVANNVRCAARDVEIDGVTIREGDAIAIPSCFHGLDERQFADPTRIDFDREMAQTATFGWGPHRCAGANLARLEMRILLEEWLPRIPDFEIDPAMPIVQQIGGVNSMVQLPLRWDVV